MSCVCMLSGSGHIPVFGLWISIQTESVCVADLSKLESLFSYHSCQFILSALYLPTHIKQFDRCMKYLLNTNHCNCNHETFIKHESLYDK